MEVLIVDYFKTLFLAFDQPENLEFLLGLTGCVTEQMNRELKREFTIEEVHKALMQMHSTKTSSLDEMSLVFFQQHWHIMGKSITKAILSVPYSGEIPSELHHTYIRSFLRKATPLELLAINLLACIIYFRNLFPK